MQHRRRKRNKNGDRLHRGSGERRIDGARRGTRRRRGGARRRRRVVPRARLAKEARGAAHVTIVRRGLQGVRLGDANHGVASDLDAARRSIDALKKQIEDEALEDAARRQHDQAGVEARIENIKKYMRESETLKERVQELEVRSAAAADSNGSVQRDVAALRGQIESSSRTSERSRRRGPQASR